MEVEIREYTDKDLEEMIQIWNEIVEGGVAYPQMDPLTTLTARELFARQSYSGVAVDVECKTILGLYILHPNNIGRCGHLCNASFAVGSYARGKGIGRKLVLHCINQAKELKFGILQFNAVVKSNYNAIKLYQELGFVQLGVIPGGFLLSDGTYEDIIPHYKVL